MPQYVAQNGAVFERGIGALGKIGKHWVTSITYKNEIGAVIYPGFHFSVCFVSFLLIYELKEKGREDLRCINFHLSTWST